MATFILVPGAGGVAWYWHNVVPLLERAGHEAIAVDLPGDDANAGLSLYADRVVEAIGGRGDLALVAQSLAGFTAPLVCARVRVRTLVFINAMIPLPGETAGAWWANTGSDTARTEAARSGGYSPNFDLFTYFLHDVPQDVIAQAATHQRAEAGAAFAEPCQFQTWPEVPIHALGGRDDRFFPVAFQRRTARDRLGLELDEVAGGHLVALSNPEGLAQKLLACL